MRLFLIRHGRPEVAQGVCYGRSDLDVSDAEQDRVLASVINDLPRGSLIYTSPLRRCRELAVRLAAQLDSSILEDARLAEMDFGAWETRAWDDIPRAEIEAWAKDLTGYRPGGGESVLDVARRVHAFYLEMQAAQLEHAIVVCHAGTMRLFSQCQHGATVEKIALHAAQARHEIAYGQLHTLFLRGALAL